MRTSVVRRQPPGKVNAMVGLNQALSNDSRAPSATLARPWRSSSHIADRLSAPACTFIRRPGVSAPKA
jgi:hypothetical protein